MYSFRELVESMEKKTSDSGKKQSSPTQPAPESISSCEAFMVCEITRRSQCKAEATNETEDAWERREGLWDCNESMEDKEQARLETWWREEESGVMRANEQYKNCIEYEATHSNRKEIREALILNRKYVNLTSGQLISSIDNLHDSTKLNCYVLPEKPTSLVDLAHQEGACYVTHSSPDVHGLERQRVRSNQVSKHEQDNDCQQDSPAHSFRRLSEDKNPVSDKHKYLEGCERKVFGIDNQYKARERAFMSEGKGYSLNFSDDTRSDCQRLGAGNLGIATSLKGIEGGTLEESTCQEIYFHATRNVRQYDDEWHSEATGKETPTQDEPVLVQRSQTKSQQACSPNLSFMTTPLTSNASVAAPIIRNSQQTTSAKFKNASHCYFRTMDNSKVEREWTKHNLSIHEKQPKSKNSFNLLSPASPSLGRKISTRGTAASKRRNSGIPSTCSKRNLAKKPDGAWKTDKRPQDDKARNINRKNRNETQNAFSNIINKDEDTRGNEAPRSTSATLKFRCPHCSCWWQDEASLASHLRQHALARPFACPDCPSRFNQLVHLQIHRRTHTGEKPFRCATCSASFSRKDRLRSHERRHSGEQPYTCPYCSLSFRDAASLKSHVSVHAHQPPFTCRICRSTFAHLSTFTTHWRLHK